MNQPAFNQSSGTPFDAADDLPALYKLLDGVKMKNGWAKPTPSIYPQPRQAFAPAHWHYSDARAALHAAGRLVGTEWAERRNLIMANPIPGNDYPTVSTLVGAYQMVKGGETARSHRHTPNAMRVVVEAAENTFTVFDGIKIPMLPGDVLLTPNWCYHGHANDSQQDAYWIDFLDAPLVQYLGPMFYNEHPNGLEPVTGTDANHPMRFAFHDYHPKLLAAKETSPGVRLLELGPPTLVTFDRTAVSIEAGAKWNCERSTGNRIYTVIAGAGRSRAGDLDFTWQRGDMFAVPSWNAHTHEATADAVLLQVSDEPLMRLLNWNRTGPA